MVVGHFTQKLLDRMNKDINWDTLSISYDYIELINIRNRTVLDNTEDQYTFVIVYEQELYFYVFHQNTLTNYQ